MYRYVLIALGLPAIWSPRPHRPSHSDCRPARPCCSVCLRRAERRGPRDTASLSLARSHCLPLGAIARTQTLVGVWPSESQGRWMAPGGRMGSHPARHQTVFPGRRRTARTASRLLTEAHRWAFLSPLSDAPQARHNSLTGRRGPLCAGQRPVTGLARPPGSQSGSHRATITRFPPYRQPSTQSGHRRACAGRRHAGPGFTDSVRIPVAGRPLIFCVHTGIAGGRRGRHQGQQARRGRSQNNKRR